MKLWAYDPGGTTGWALFEREHEDLYWTLRGWGEVTLWRGIDEQISASTHHVVYEDIKPLHPSFNPIGIQVIGVIRYLCERYSITHTLQSPVAITGLSRSGIVRWNGIESQHSRDAIMHGLVFLGLPRIEIATPQQVRIGRR